MKLNLKQVEGNNEQKSVKETSRNTRENINGREKKVVSLKKSIKQKKKIQIVDIKN